VIYTYNIALFSHKQNGELNMDEPQKHVSERCQIQKVTDCMTSFTALHPPISNLLFAVSVFCGQPLTKNITGIKHLT
jgi:hypothetical protein